MENDTLLLRGDIGDVTQIFKRDQRTIKNRKEVKYAVDTFQVEFCDDCKKDRFESRGTKRDDFSISRFPVMFFKISNLGMCTVTGTPHRTCNTRCRIYKSRINVNNLIKRLVEVFIFGVCLLTIVQVPTAMSAPTSCRERKGANESMPAWKNPCGQVLMLDNSSGAVSSGENDTELICPILAIARIARDYMHNFRKDYVQNTFHVSYDHHVNMTKNMAPHSWLPSREREVPKSLGEAVDAGHLEEQKLDEFLKNIYEAMQKYAVGIEQVVWDQKRINGNFQGQFIETESNLIKVLCELRTAMFIKNIIPSRDVDRCIMDDTSRIMNETAHRNLRDWMIFRECLNGLEYLVQVLEYIQATSPSS